ncbi:chitin deacetylase [Lichtheimia corymbifera JMRC:FSU:9682]|uniref:chitin deacetylase n=1 Tax=Lichtheimia corymbifera JMRC:FSU:9682 TaxID=1263082 RepID=A0A068S9S2_9FUNG|nr:chitin deacetylase [Lichtheimia corymbifera JMRC:FSU:9682]
MYLKAIALSLAIAQASQAVSAAEYWESFKSNVDPTNIKIPEITQTTAYDESKTCVGYDASPAFTFNQAEWPTAWQIATSNGMNTSQEFVNLYNSINWDSMPNIPVRKSVNGALQTEGYDPSDPDCWWSASTCTQPKHENINADIYECPEPDTWGLTFDDGPNCSHNAFYDYLQSRNLKASMFYIGSNVVNWPYGAMRGVRDGHHIAQHTWSHGLMTTLTNQEVLAELYYTQKAIKMVTGITPRHWRPAFGDVDDRVRWIATQLNLTTILWNLDTDDWAAGVTEPVETVKKHYEDFIAMGSNGTFDKSGNIVLQHEINNTTMQMAVDYIPQIQKAYKHVVDVATCMNITYPYMETNVKFAGFAEATKSNSSDNSSSGSGDKSEGSSSSNDESGASSLIVSTAGLFVAAGVGAFALL